MENIKHTILFDEHVKLNAKMFNFNGWDMPLQYKGALAEHRFVREKSGLFDTSHMGRIFVSGRDAKKFLQYIATNNLDKIKKSEMLYTHACNENGGILDDFMICCVENGYMCVVNASNKDKMFEWFKKNMTGFDAVIEDLSDFTGMIALQGPLAEEVISYFFDVGELDYLKVKKTSKNNTIISRSGYTGEDGFEIIMEKHDIARFWNEIFEKFSKFVFPCGLSVRDILRLEMGYSLYGNDIDEDTSPFEANLGWVVDFKCENFIGRKALLQQADKGVRKKLRGFVVLDKSMPRHGYELMKNKKKCGYVTSGGYSPVLEQFIGLAYFDDEFSTLGNIVEMPVRDKMKKIKIVDIPFIKSNVKRKAKK